MAAIKILTVEDDDAIRCGIVEVLLNNLVSVGVKRLACCLLLGGQFFAADRF